jgi:predicted molibdopterin-dependent oxidoreductase YjgC
VGGIAVRVTVGTSELVTDGRGVTVLVGVGVGAQAANSNSTSKEVHNILVFICHLHRSGRGVYEQPPPGQIASV